MASKKATATTRRRSKGATAKRSRRSTHGHAHTPGATRPIWSGHLTFGLVSIPIRVHGAVDASEKVSFRQLHRKDHAPIVYKKFCSREDVEVPADEIVRGYEVGKDEFTVVEGEELEHVQEELGEGQHTIDVVQFVEPASLDPLLFERPYYLVPDTGGEKAYGLLRDALRDAGRIGVARVYLRRPLLGAILPHEEVLVLQAMRSFGELRATRAFAIPAAKAGEAEKRMARALIDEMSAEWDPRAHANRYRATLEKLLTGRPRFALGEKGASAGETRERRGEVVDLMDALRRSLRDGGGPARGGARRRPAQAAKRVTSGAASSSARRTSSAGAEGRRRATSVTPSEA